MPNISAAFFDRFGLILRFDLAQVFGALADDVYGPTGHGHRFSEVDD
jgi:hypothetical protein